MNILVNSPRDYAAAYVFRHGGNPYDYFQTSKALLEITGYMGNNPYYYVPWVAWAFTPLTFIPFRVSFLIWNTINLILWIIGLRQIKVLLGIPYNGWRLYALYFVVTLSFAWVTFRFGQIGFLIMSFLLAALIAAQREKWIQSGVWLALCLIKPNVTLIPVGAICLWLLLKRVWNPIIKIFGLSVIAIAPLFGTTPLNSYVMVLYLTGLLALYYIQRQQLSSSEIFEAPFSNREM